MPKLRALRKPEEIAAVPSDQPVAIDLGDDEVKVEAETPPEKKEQPRDGQGRYASSEPEPEPKPEPEPEPEPEPAVNPLQKQLDDMKKAETVLREQLAAERARAERQAREQEAELSRERAGREQAEYDTVLNAFGAASGEMEAAERDLEVAHAANDTKGIAAASRRMSIAGARLAQLEDAKAVIENRREEEKRRPPPQPTADPIDRLENITAGQRTWLKAHRDAFDDPQKNEKLRVAHIVAVHEKNHPVDSEGYYKFLEERLGYRKPEPEGEEPEPKPKRSTPVVSAPVSREATSLSTGRPQRRTVELTPQQREHARISGVDEVTYAKGVLELERRKALGMYPDRG